MNRRFLTITTLCVVALLVSVVGAAGQGPVDFKEATPTSVEAVVASKISYQGVLRESGSLVTGNRNMQFLFFTNNTCAGTALETVTKNNVPVQNGLFSVDLSVNQSNFNGQALWLRVRVGSTNLGCTEILAAPYALSLRPGAHVVDNNGSLVYYVENLGSGDGIRAFSHATASNYGAVYAVTDGTGTGLWGLSTAGMGVYGRSDNAATGKGVYGTTAGSDAYQSAGVWGEKTTGDGTAVMGKKTGNTGVGVFGLNYGSAGSGVAGNSTNWHGVTGLSTNYRGVYGETSRSDNNYGVFTPDNLYSLNYHTMGAVMQVAQNGGDQPLQPGDVVAFSGAAAPLEAGGPPVIQVMHASTANATAVAGVVSARLNIKSLLGTEPATGDPVRAGWDGTIPGAVPPGDYLLLVVQGPTQVRASATGGAIQAGDLLASAASAGLAGKAGQISVEGVTLAAPGTVFGKALEPLQTGDGLITVYVTLQ